MKTQYQKHINPIGAVLLLSAAALIACGENAPSVTTDAVQTDAPITETEAVTEINRPALTMPETDFGGAAYRIYATYESDARSLIADSITGEPVNDIIYERNAALSEQYNFVYEASWSTDDVQHRKDVAAAVLAGEDAWELISGACVYTCNNAVEGIYQNLYDIPYLNFQEAWWSQQSVEEMTLNGKMFTTLSSINYKPLANASVIFFNKKLLDAHDMELPYQWVLDGKWTLDRLITETKGFYRDLNGNSTRDPDDQFGFITHPEQVGILTACGTQVLAKTDDGGLEFTVLSDKMATLVSELFSWYYESGDVFLTTFRVAEADFTSNIFKKENTAYSYGQLNYAPSHYRDSSLSYGIAPMPKYDEQQESYYSLAYPNLFSVPLTCQNTELAGFVFEAMTYYGYYDVSPAYYELTLQGKIADAQEDVAMLEVINNSLTASFAYCYDNWQGFAHLLGERMKFTRTSGTKDLASAFEKYKKNAQKRLDLVIAGFADQ
ncbi:MAG: hypothetical protein E7604_10085 [Ruminococcaceae bacterium]|nr:hypothetical protein [Oscillospiraceae bacterium]